MINILIKYAKKGKRFAKRLLKNPAPAPGVESHPPHLIFVFGGRTQYWPGMGKELFNTEPVFKESITNCDALAQEINGISILANFESDVDESFFDNEAKIVLTITAIQIGLNNLWKSKGILPDSIMGVSSGEAVGVYAAGAISLEDVFRIFTCSVLITQLDKKQCITLFLFTTMENATELCKGSPVWVAPVYDAGDKIVLLYCKTGEVAEVLAYFKSKSILCKKIYDELFWPFHTDLISKHEDIILNLIKDIVTRPLQIDYYSSTLAKVFPKNSIISAEYLYETLRKPVLINPTVSLFAGHENLIMVHFGPAFFLKTQIQNILVKQNKNVALFDSLNQNSSEHGEFQSAFQAAEKNITNIPQDTDALAQFLASFNLENSEFLSNPYPTFNYLRANGSVHFIPTNNAWLVLDYDDINYALKQPGLFSSKILSGFDYVLIGTDPPEHTLVRNLLQPAFSPRVFDELGHFASEKAHSLLKSLALEPEFDFVQQFSLPMAQAVIAHFLGIDDEGALELKQIMEENGHTYHMSYLPQMEIFFTNYLKQKQIETGDDVGSLVASFVKNGDLSFNQAVCLMRTLWIAGMTTTSMLLSSSVNFLLKNPNISDELRADEKLIPKFIEECVRLEAPESELTRITTQEVELAGKTIPEGSVVILSIRAANREPRYYPDPNALSLTRPAKRNLSFGGGYHYCLGIGMAKTEALHVIKAVLEELPNLRFAQQDQQDYYFPSPHFRGLESLPLTNL